MKKNEKLLQTMREYVSEDSLGILIGIVAMIITVLVEIIGIIMAATFNNYFILSGFSYAIITVALCYTKKVFFRNLNYRLLKRTKLAELILYILAITTIILSWKYFIAFILTVIVAVMHADFYKMIEVEE